MSHQHAIYSLTTGEVTGILATNSPTIIAANTPEGFASAELPEGCCTISCHLYWDFAEEVIKESHNAFGAGYTLAPEPT